MDAKLLGNTIREHRKRKGWIQAELAEKLKINPNLIGYYERGKFAPGRDTLFELALILDFSLDELNKCSKFSGTTVYPNEINELLNKLPLAQRKAVLKSFKAFLESLTEDYN